MKKLLLILLIVPMTGYGQFLPIKKSGADIKQCSDGGFVVVGESSSDLYLFKTDRNGNLLWEKKFGSNTIYEASSVQICSDGGFIVAGKSYSGANANAYLFKTDRNGHLLWEKKIGGDKYDHASSVQICSDGGFVVAGRSAFALNSSSDAYLFKTDRNGNLLWEKKFGGADNKAQANSVQICSDGGFILAGRSSSSNNSDAYLFKTDKNGNLLWEKKFGGGKYDHASSVQICSDGGFIVAGKSYSGANANAYLFKTDRNGNLLWEKKFGGGKYDHASSVQICSDGGYVMIGSHLIITNTIGEVYEATLTDRITSYVEAEVNIWQAKGEFEKSSDYKIRVTQSSRNKKIADIQKDALQYFKTQYKKKVTFETVSLNEYDADNETFLLDPWPLKQFILPVPIEKAPYFKRNYVSSKFENVDFIIMNDEFILSHIEFTVDNEVYTYDISNNNLYTTTTFDYNFDEIEIDINEDLSASNRVNNKHETIGKSGVDIDIPMSKQVENRFAIVIGNEDYSSFQRTLNIEQNVDYAENDATVFKKYCLNTLGVKEGNMHFLLNATAGQMSQEIDLLTKILSKLDSASELIVYYAGHGYPDELTKVPYLIPVDVSASNLSSAIKLDDLYQKLANTNASKITIFLDACFTGGGRNSGLVASRGIKVKPKQGSLNGNIVVFSASSEDQSSLPYHDEGHGVFTYFLLKKFQETQGNVTLGELSEYLEKNVSIQSLRVNQKEQDPTVNTSQKVINDWRNWRF
jgi:hypothetical protein